ncbi:hypothetical protein F4805DRAFT_461392 [Annulohypoxylon moriforme]|nr:hypothetical protein F4805DRAFT_461392 [Annulohypoxylon moriforme]
METETPEGELPKPASPRRERPTTVNPKVLKRRRIPIDPITVPRRLFQETASTHWEVKKMWEHPMPLRVVDLRSSESQSDPPVSKPKTMLMRFTRHRRRLHRRPTLDEVANAYSGLENDRIDEIAHQARVRRRQILKNAAEAGMVNGFVHRDGFISWDSEPEPEPPKPPQPVREYVDRDVFMGFGGPPPTNSAGWVQAPESVDRDFKEFSKTNSSRSQSPEPRPEVDVPLHVLTSMLMADAYTGNLLRDLFQLEEESDHETGDKD